MHVACPHLHDVRILCYQIHLSWVHHFGDDGESTFLSRRVKELEPFFFQSLEAVGRRAGLKGPTSQKIGPGFLYQFGGLADLLTVFDRTGPGHHDDGFSPYGNASNLDD